jgi:nitrite reductase/ring-hydroxylating ferredoxin subunit
MVDQDRDYLSKSPDEKPHVEQPQWRQDFPIDVPQDNYISRREFTKFLVLISGAFVVGQSWIVWENWRRARRGAPPIVQIATLDKIPVGSSLVFHYPNEDEPCLLMRPEESTLLAYSQKCTHLSCAVIPELEKKRIVCPCHHGYFALDDGRVLAGPPQRPLPRITLQVKGNAIYATGVELRTNA